MSEQDMDRPADIGQEEAAPARPSVGQQLAAQREAHGWSIEQVASHLNMAPRQIQAIENNDFDALPGMAIARGFIRSYAKLLQIDAKPLLDEIGGGPVAAMQPLAARASLDRPFSEARVPSMMDKPGLPVKKILGIVLIVAIIALVLAVQQSGKLSEISADVERELNNVAGQGTSSSAPVSPPETAAQEGVALQPTGTENLAAPASTSAAEPAISESSPAAASPETAKAEASPLAPAEALVLRVREDSWVELKRGDGSVVLSRVLQAGETETVEVKGPLSLTVGNAPGVEAILRGKPLDLKTNRNSKVASLNLK